MRGEAIDRLANAAADIGDLNAGSRAAVVWPMPLFVETTMGFHAAKENARMKKRHPLTLRRTPVKSLYLTAARNLTVGQRAHCSTHIEIKPPTMHKHDDFIL